MKRAKSRSRESEIHSEFKEEEEEKLCKTIAPSIDECNERGADNFIYVKVVEEKCSHYNSHDASKPPN